MSIKAEKSRSVFTYFEGMVVVALYVIIFMIIIDVVRFDWNSGGYVVLAGKAALETLMVVFVLMIVFKFKIKSNNYLAMISVVVGGAGLYMYYEYAKYLGIGEQRHICLNYLDYCAALILFNIVFILRDCLYKHDRT